MAHPKVPLFALLALLCAQTQDCAAPGPKPLTYDPQQTEEIERQSAVTSAKIFFNGGDIVDGYRVGVRKDTTEWYEKDSLGNIDPNVRYVAPTSDISSISISEQKELQGLLIGAAIGVALGAIIYEGSRLPDIPPPGQDDDGTTEFINWIARNAGFEGCTIGLGALCGVGGLSAGAGIRQWYSNWSMKDSIDGQPIHWVTAGEDSTKVDTLAKKVETTLKIDTTKYH